MSLAKSEFVNKSLFRSPSITELVFCRHNQFSSVQVSLFHAAGSDGSRYTAQTINGLWFGSDT